MPAEDDVISPVERVSLGSAWFIRPDRGSDAFAQGGQAQVQSAPNARSEATKIQGIGRNVDLKA